MPATKDNLMAAVSDLERVLGETGATAELEPALAGLETALQRHAQLLRQPDGLVGKLDRPRIPSPGLDRQTGHLGEEAQRLLCDVQELRQRLPAGDPAALCQRARILAEGLEHFEDKEARLILDTVNTDVGAGE
jgi:hypothetical protein